MSDTADDVASSFTTLKMRLQTFLNDPLLLAIIDAASARMSRDAVMAWDLLLHLLNSWYTCRGFIDLEADALTTLLGRLLNEASRLAHNDFTACDARHGDQSANAGEYVLPPHVRATLTSFYKNFLATEVLGADGKPTGTWTATHPPNEQWWKAVNERAAAAAARRIDAALPGPDVVAADLTPEQRRDRLQHKLDKLEATLAAVLAQIKNLKDKIPVAYTQYIAAHNTTPRGLRRKKRYSPR
jgi:hypothetical protein